MMVIYDTDDGNYWLTLIQNGPVPGSEKDFKGVVATSGYNYDDDKAAINANGYVYDIADDAAVVILDKDDDYNYMTGESLKTRNGISFVGTGYLIVNNDEEVVAMFGDTNSTVTSGDKMYGYVVDTLVAENADGDEAVFVDIITADGYQDEVETDASTRNADQMVGKVYSYTMDGDVYALTEETVTLGEITGVNGNVIRIDNNKRYTLTDDSVVIAIDSSDSTGVTDDITYAGDTAVVADKGQDNVLYAVNGDEEIEVMIVETSTNDVFTGSNYNK